MNIIDYSLTLSEIPYDNYCYYPITSDLSTISDVSISSISNALSDNNNSSEIPHDNYCYYPITSDLSTISDASISNVSISSISNALSDNNNSSEIPHDNYLITSDLSTIISNALSNNNNSSEIPYDNYPITSDLSTIISNAFSDNNNSSEIPYDNYPITSNLSTISDVSISSISNALSDNNNSSEIPYDNYPITSNLSTISDASISDEQPIVQSSRPTDHKHKIRIFTLESLTDLLNGVRISFDGNHNDMTQSWSQEELNVRRRVVQFFKTRAKKRIMASFKAVDLIEQPKNGIFVSCLYWYDKKIQCDKWYFTSTDYLNLLESLTGIRLTSDEKNRIRRNLEEYKPITVGKNKNDSDEIYKDLMSYSFAKPRNVEKDIKLYEWRHLLHAVEKIINKYGKKKKII
ncbi:unnamed protein product [Rhizophagus irregularis]|uniref:DUF7082 domain-containing protein n=2 Tax=Rhizophagus irregularis TaxID=588596 RepID=A0A916EKL2_9GLOM|nr:unnamed protein product [Rhizophagus irregularis]CAB5395689.1 unnamed protein product [Rhizophagus irregularis]